jgi:hypothetical protein
MPNIITVDQSYSIANLLLHIVMDNYYKRVCR